MGIFSELKGKISDKVASKIDATYRSYKKKEIKRVENEIANLSAQEKGLKGKLLPIQQKIAELRARKEKLEKYFKELV